MNNGCKKCRREGTKLVLKGERCLSAKCSFTKRPYAPGDHGQSFAGKMSEYGKQLREKQKAKWIYMIGEDQFGSIVSDSNNKTGIKTENLMKTLETRLDTIVYRLGFGKSRAHARQLVNHGLFMVNNRKVSIPSFQTKIGDVVSPKNIASFNDVSLSDSVKWLDIDKKKMSAKVVHLPTREEIDAPINESLIIEYYSR